MADTNINANATTTKSARTTQGRRCFSTAAAFSNTRLSRPEIPPKIGRYTSATIRDADRTKIKVTGNIPMNCPATPGQNSIGKNAQSVVAVELITGQNIRLAAST